MLSDQADHPHSCVHHTPHVPTTLTNLYTRQVDIERMRSISTVLGQHAHPCSFSPPLAPSFSTTTSPSPHGSPPHSPPTILIPGRYRVRGAWFLVWHGNIPAPARSPDPSFPPPQRPLLPHPTGRHHTPRQLFRCQIDTACPAHSFRFGGGIPLHLLNLPVPASHHLDGHFSPTLQVATTLSANRFDAKLMLPAPRPIFGLAVEYPRTCPIS
jgi:hypothetical protein